MQVKRSMRVKRSIRVSVKTPLFETPAFLVLTVTKPVETIKRTAYWSRVYRTKRIANDDNYAQMIPFIGVVLAEAAQRHPDVH